MGDPRLQKNPRPVSREPDAGRAHEAQSHEEMIERVLAEDQFAWIQNQFKELAGYTQATTMSAKNESFPSRT